MSIKLLTLNYDSAGAACGIPFIPFLKYLFHDHEVNLLLIFD